MRRDPRIDDYARLLVERSIGVRAGDQVLVRGNHLARPIIEAVVELVAAAGAYPLLQLAFEQLGGPFARTASLDLLRTPAPLQRRIWEEVDGIVTIWSPENAHEGSDLSSERVAALQDGLRPLRERTMAMSVPWVIAEWPVEALAAEAGMSLDDYTEFVFGSVLRDWDAELERMRSIADVFDTGSEVRIVGPRTDLLLSLEGRVGTIDDGHVNMPGGEVFYSPLETSATGTIEFCEFPALYYGSEVAGARLVFEAGTVVDASAESGEEFLLATLDTDPGARRIGELGIGCNRGIQQFTKNVGFDEKIDGTIHLAVGNSYSSTGGVNTSAVHWDIVKDLRVDGRLEVDGRVVQANGAWLL